MEAGTDMQPAKARKNKSSALWKSKGWKTVDVSDAFLLGAEEGGFAGLEILEEPYIADGSLPPIDGPSSQPSKHKTQQRENKSESASETTKYNKKKRKAARKESRAQEVDTSTEPDMEELKLRIAQLEAENRSLKKKRMAGAEATADAEQANGSPHTTKQLPPQAKKTKALKKTKVPAPSNQLEEPQQLPDMSAWTEFLLHPSIERALAVQGFSRPTPIQAACLLPAARGRLDIIGAAQTGSGKTLAFGLPILQVLLQEREAAGPPVVADKDEEGEGDGEGQQEEVRPLRALILCPTRELALQVATHLTAIARPCGIRVAAIVGGLAPVKQQRLLRARPEVVVATPGRLWDLMRQGQAHLAQLDDLSFLVLDEADRMVQQGCYQELNSILEQIPRACKERGGKDGSVRKRKPKRAAEEEEEQEGDEGPAPGKRRLLQTFVFSATLTLPLSLRKRLKKGGGGAGGGTAMLQTLMDRIPLRGDPRIVDLTTQRRLAEQVQEAQVVCLDAERDETLYYILARHPGRTLVFVNAVSATRRVCSLLKLLGLPAYALHAQQQQRQRLKALDRFRSQEQAILVATDVAARGLDIKDVPCVVHYQLPASADTYIHRSGRTARAEASGISIALVTPKESARFTALCKVLERPPPPSFPVEPALMKQAHKRVRLAERIDQVERGYRKDHAMDTWTHNNAEALDLELSDDERPKKKGARTEDEGAPVTSSRAQKREAAELLALKAELAQLVATPLQHSVSQNYFASGLSMATFKSVAADADGKAKDAGEVCETAVPLGAVAQTVALAQRLQQSKAAAQALSKQSKAQKKARGGRQQFAAAAMVAAVQAKAGRGKLKRHQPPPDLARLLVSRNAMKKQKKGLVVVGGAAFGRDTLAPNALEALRSKMASK